MELPNTEPDHSAGIADFMQKYPNATVVASQKAFAMMQSFFGKDYADRRTVVGEGSSLSLGRHTLTFAANTVSIRSALNAQSKQALEVLADELCGAETAKA